MFLIRQMQTLMRMEHTLATATERLEHTRSIYNELQAQVTDRCVARFETFITAVNESLGTRGVY